MQHLQRVSKCEIFGERRESLVICLQECIVMKIFAINLEVVEENDQR